MKWMLCVLLVVSSPALATQAPPASEASVRELLEVMKAPEMLELSYRQMESMYLDSLRQAMGGEVSGEQKARLARLSNRLIGLMRKEMPWEVVAPLYVEAYRGAFTEQEVQETLAFYRTPSGQVVAEKTPAVMTELARSMNARMMDLMPAMERIMLEELDLFGGGPEALPHAGR